jgi:hypothetical protein
MFDSIYQASFTLEGVAGFYNYEVERRVAECADLAYIATKRTVYIDLYPCSVFILREGCAAYSIRRSH